MLASRIVWMMFVGGRLSGTNILESFGHGRSLSTNPLFRRCPMGFGHAKSVFGESKKKYEAVLPTVPPSPLPDTPGQF